MDLDNFKTVNDSLGHSAGDSLLVGIAERLREVSRDSDTVSRLGGDEFLIVLPELADVSGIHSILDRLSEKMRAPLMIDGKEVSTSLSVGVAIAPDDGVDFSTLLQKADIALYRAKESGRSTYRFFDKGMDADIADHLVIRNGLARALEQGEFSLHYQPQIDIASGALVGVEALLRWHHPELGLVSPLKFIPIAETSGLIIPIGEWVLREACRQAKAWQVLGLKKMKVAVNVSAVQFRRGNVGQLVADALAESGLAPECLELELTESILLHDTESMLNTARELRRLGVLLSIDDFGTGYSSMAYLKRFAVDTLKIDRSFIHNVTLDADNAAIAFAIIQLAHSLGLKTIAEGVEDEPTLDFLRKNLCDQVQGYLVDPEKLTTL